jgi:hypothetical protein
MTASFFIAGGLLFAILLLLAFRNALAPKRPREAPTTPVRGDAPCGLPSRLLGESICSRRDLEFVAMELPGLRQRFIRERKHLLLLWLQDLREAVVETVSFYRASVRASASVKATVELKIAVDYVAFLLLWEIARGLVWIQNPAAAQDIVWRLFEAAEQISIATGRLIAPVDSPSLVDVGANS